jgi:outer membrane protein assembly factor BamB
MSTLDRGSRRAGSLLSPRLAWGVGAVIGLVSLALGVWSWQLLTATELVGKQGLQGVILGAVAVFLPLVWLGWLSPLPTALRLWLAACGFAAVSTYMQTGDATEQALANIMTVAFGILAMVAALAGIGSLLKPKHKWTVFAAAFVSITLFFVFFAPDDPTGNMVPRFRYRFGKRPDQLLATPASTTDAVVDVSAESPDDFPRFLGPDANGRVNPSFVLATDWEKNPPRELWRNTIGAGWSAFAIVGNFAFTLEQRGDDELVTCYAVDSGQLLWSHGIKARHDTPLGGIGPRSTPTVTNGRVYALGATAVLRCLDGASGQLLWSHDLLAERGISPAVEASNIAWGRAASPLVWDDKVIVPAGGPDPQNCVSLIAYDAATGEKIWQGGSSQVSYCSPQRVTLADVEQVLIVNESSVAGHDAQSGQQLWEFPWPGESNGAASNSQAHVLDAERVLITKGYGTGAAVFRVTKSGEGWSADETPVWRNHRLFKTKLANLVCDDSGHAFGLSEGVLECGDLATGERLWRGGRYGHGQILLVGDTLLVISEAGELAIGKADASGWKELGMIEALTGKTWNNLALSGRKLLVRNAEEAACYELPIVAEDR